MNSINQGGNKNTNQVSMEIAIQASMIILKKNKKNNMASKSKTSIKSIKERKLTWLDDSIENPQ
jgi:hypothetical protein